MNLLEARSWFARKKNAQCVVTFIDKLIEEFGATATVSNINLVELTARNINQNWKGIQTR